MASVLLGNSDGSFQAPVSYVVSGVFDTYRVSVAVGDFNRDGHLDLVVAGRYGVRILLGKGDGSFQDAGFYAAGSGYHLSLAVGDFDGDGHLDLAVANYEPYDPSYVSVLLGNGDGTFQAPQNYDSGSVPESVAVGDFDGDGHLDLAVANGNDSVSVLLGKGDGSFQAPQSYAVGRYPRSVAVGDFDGDGHLDLAVANNYDNTVSVLLGIGDGTFQAAQSYAVGRYPRSVAVGDFNADGHLDLAVANANDGTVSILLGKGDGTFQDAQSYAVGSFPLSIAVGDLSGGGFPDLAVAAGDGVTVLLNAADWGGGPGPAPPGRPALHRPVTSQSQMEPVSAMLAASKPQAEYLHPLTFIDLPLSPVRPWPVEMEAGQSAHFEATVAPRLLLTARHAQDAVFEQWGDSVLDVQAWNVLN